MLNQEVWEETNNHIDPQRKWNTSESAAGGLVNRHPSVSCETEEQEGRERESQLRDQMTTNRSRRSRGLFETPQPHCGSQLFAPPRVFPLIFFFFLYPFLSPEISFQQPEPCKNRPRVLKPGPVCKNVPACYAAQGHWCRGRGGPHLSLCSKHPKFMVKVESEPIGV